MTVLLSGKEIASKIEEKFPGSVVESGQDNLVVKSDSLADVARFLRDSEGLDFDFLNFITAVDYYDHFEVVYLLSSLEHNHSLTIKTRCYDRENPVLPSVGALRTVMSSMISLRTARSAAFGSVVPSWRSFFSLKPAKTSTWSPGWMFPIIPWAASIGNAIENLEALKQASFSLMGWARDNLTMESQAHGIVQRLDNLLSEKRVSDGIRLPDIIYVEDALQAQSRDGGAP